MLCIRIHENVDFTNSEDIHFGNNYKTEDELVNIYVKQNLVYWFL